MIGRNAWIGPSFPTPTSCFPQPNWKIITITPYAAPIDSRFITAALSGTRIERNTAISSRKLRMITIAMNSGRR